MSDAVQVRYSGTHPGTAEDVIKCDLDYVQAALKEELTAMSGKSLLVTGGAGFLGYYLIQTALTWNQRERNAPIRITVYDNYVRGVPTWLRRVESAPHFKLVKYNVADSLPQNTGRFDYIIHAASIASPIYYRRYPIETMDANVGGLRRLLEYCRKQADQGEPVSGLLFYSTSEIYGNPDPAYFPTPETYAGYVSCIGPRACYDESKRYAETLCVNFARVYDLPVKITRPFNNYGPGLRVNDRRVIADFVGNILAGRNIEMLSDGAPTRTYCYVADAVIGYYQILVRGRQGEAYNVGADEPEISVADLAERLVTISRELFGYRGTVVRGISADPAYLTDNPQRRCPSIDKSRRELGFKPCISLDEGLRRSLLWYRQHPDAQERVQ